MGLGLESGGKGHIYAVDPHSGGKGFIEELGDSASEFNSLQSFNANIARFNLQSLITPVVATSNDAVANWNNGKIRLMFIDGWHTYDAVKHDILAWSPYFAKDAVIALHDYQMDEIQQAIHDSMIELSIPSSKLQVIKQEFAYFSV